MIRHDDSRRPGPRTARETNAGAAGPLLSLFAIPKPHAGQIATIQSNAIRSWARLAPHIEVFLFDNSGDERLAQLAAETGATMLSLDPGAPPAPCLQAAFAEFHRRATGQVLGYSNADMMFDTDLLEVAGQLLDSELHSFLAIGQRTEMDLPERVDIDDPLQVNRWFAEAQARGGLASVVCKDFFLFSRDMFHEVPAFVVGRGNWDNWMVHHAHTRGPGGGRNGPADRHSPATSVRSLARRAAGRLCDWPGSPSKPAFGRWPAPVAGEPGELGIDRAGPGPAAIPVDPAGSRFPPIPAVNAGFAVFRVLFGDCFRCNCKPFHIHHKAGFTITIRGMNAFADSLQRGDSIGEGVLLPRPWRSCAITGPAE